MQLRKNIQRSFSPSVTSEIETQSSKYTDSHPEIRHIPGQKIRNWKLNTKIGKMRQEYRKITHIIHAREKLSLR